jgi:peptidoglycan/LPS O-acetylase OafA/YrhL
MQWSRFVVSPGVFRLSLAYIVFVNHSIPLHLGSLAVYLFFMLSGYWVRQMWDKEYVPTDAPYRNFIISRFWRLIPIYYIALLIFYTTDYLFPTSRVPYRPPDAWGALHYYVSQALLLGYAPLPYAAKIIPPVWSLDIEMQFYLIAPFLIALISRYPVRSLPRLALYALALIGFVAFVLFYGNIHAQSAFLPMYLIFFLIGLHTAEHGWQPPPSLAVTGLVTAAVLIAACIALPETRPLLVEGSFSSRLSDFNPDVNLVLAFLIAPYAMATVRKELPKGSWLARIDRDLSNVTYELYLLHFSALVVVTHFLGDRSKYQQLPAIMLAWIVMLPISWAVYLLIDCPIDRLRHQFVKSRRRTAIVNDVAVAGA